MISSRRLRIMTVVSRLCIGGPANQVILLAKNINKEKFENIIVTGCMEANEESETNRARSLGLEVVELNDMRRSIHPFYDLISVYKLSQLARRFQPDVIHSHTSKAGAVARLVAQMIKTPTAHTFHGHVFDSYFPKTMSHVFVASEKMYARKTHKLIAISSGLEKELVEKYKIGKKEQYRTIELGLDLENYRQERHGGDFRSEINVGRDCFLIGVPGRLVPIKNHIFLLKMLRELLIRVPSISKKEIMVLIIGDGEERQKIEKKIGDFNLRSTVKLLGFRKDMPRIYSDLDLTVLPSLNEGTPVTIVESMASGVPFVASDVGGVRDITLPNSGSVIPVNNHEAFQDEIVKYILKGRLSREDERNVRNAAHRRFSYKRMVQETENVYTEIS